MRPRWPAQKGLGSRSRAVVPLGYAAQAGPKRSHRRDVGGLRPARRAAFGRRQPSGRPAQALADAHAQRLSPGVRLLHMGYEIPGALGAKLADPSREIYVFLGDGTYLMMPSEIVTAVQEHIKLIIVLVDNKGFASIGGLSRSLGMGGFGTSYRERSARLGPVGRRRCSRLTTPPPRAASARTPSRPARSRNLRPRWRRPRDGPHHGHRGRNPARRRRARLRFVVGRSRGRGFAKQGSPAGARALCRGAQAGAPPPQPTTEGAIGYG